MATEGICPGCGRPLPADGLKGLCPECLMKAGFGTGAAPAPDEPTGRAAFTPPSLAEVARLFPQLEVVELLGQGGMGAVYKARQPALDRWVALKVLPPQTAVKADFSERFNREARALARLNHPHIVAVHEFGQAGGLPYFIMEYVDGVTLRHLVQTKKLAPKQALAIVPQICEALQFAHDEGVVHRDIKPENILLDKKGRVKIADFGIAKIVAGETAQRQPITQDQQVIGTPHYMAPEQVEKPHQVDHRADIYSLGVVFYEMLTGELPLGKFAPPSGKVQVDVRLDDVVLKALEKEPERRYQQASQLKTDVETITNEPVRRTQPAAGEDPLKELARLRERRRWMLWYGFIVSLIGVPIGIALHLPFVWALGICGIVLGAFKLKLFGPWLPDADSISKTPAPGDSPKSLAGRPASGGEFRWLSHRLILLLLPLLLMTALAFYYGHRLRERNLPKYETAPVTRGQLTMDVVASGRLVPDSGDTSKWEVSASLPETIVAHIEVGHDVDCLADAFPGRPFKGKVLEIADVPNSKQQTAVYSARIQVIDSKLPFRQGMSVFLTFILAQRQHTLKIPCQALLFSMPGTTNEPTNLGFGLTPGELAMGEGDERATRTVWVLREKPEPEPVRIRIGISDNAFTEVTSGLSEGERVVIGEIAGSEALPEISRERPGAAPVSKPQESRPKGPLSATETNRLALGRLPATDGTNVSRYDLAVERVLKAREECFFDLDTGQTHGPAIIGGETELPAGMDLSIPFTPVGAEFRADRVVALDHLEVQPATSADWDLSPNEIIEQLNSMGSQALGGLRARELANQGSKLPKTFLFRTSPWSEGILQIVAFTQEPAGVKLRYRFLPYGVARAAPRREKTQDVFDPPRRLVAAWPDGINIELVGLSQYPSKGGKSWRTDGYELSSSPFDESSADVRGYHPPGTRPVELTFSITGLKSGPGSEAKFEQSNAFWTGKKYKQGVWQPDIKAIGLQVPTNARSIIVTLVLNAAEELRMMCSLRTNVWLTDAASLLPSPLAKGERAVAFMSVSLRPGYGTFPQVRLIEEASLHRRTGLVTKIYALKSGEAARRLGSIKSLIGAAGEAVGDERTDSIIVSAPPSVQEGVAQFLQESGALEQSAPRSRRTVPDETSGFGPVVERVLDFDTRKPTAYLDLDTGKYLDPAYKLPFGVDSTPEGVDLRASAYESDTRARLAIDMAVRPVATNRWEATPAEVRKELKMTRSEPELRFVANEVPQLFFFRTKDIGQGILQIQVGPIVDGSHQVHIRYKILTPSAQE